MGSGYLCAHQLASLLVENKPYDTHWYNNHRDKEDKNLIFQLRKRRGVQLYLVEYLDRGHF